MARKIKLAIICNICGKEVKTASGLKMHLKQHKPLAHPEGQAHQSSLKIDNIKKEESMIKKEESMQDTPATFERLSKLFAGDQRGLLSPPLTDEERKRATLDAVRLSIVQTADVLLELAAFMHPQKMQEVIQEFKDEKDFRQVLALDWLDQSYRSLGKVDSLTQLLVRALTKQARDAGILGEGEELPDAPKTSLGPLLEELAGRVSPARR